MPQNAFSIEPFEAKRVRVESTRSFEEVLLNLRKVVGKTTIQQGSTQEPDEVPTREQFEHVIQSQVGESDFTLFFAMDYGQGKEFCELFPCSVISSVLTNDVFKTSTCGGIFSSTRGFDLPA